MSTRARRQRVPAARRARAVDQLRGLVSLRVDPGGLIAIVDAAADALADGHLGAARDLLGFVCSDREAERILLGLLEDGPCPAVAKPARRAA